MQRYNEIKDYFVKTAIVSLSVIFIAGVVSTTKVFADEPGSVFLWGGYDDDGLFGTYAEEHGSPEYSIFGDAEEGLQKLIDWRRQHIEEVNYRRNVKRVLNK